MAVAVAFWGFRRSTKADRLRAFFELQDRYLAEPVRAGRAILHREIAPCAVDSIPDLPAATLSSAGYTLAVLNSLAIACEGGYVEAKLIASSMGRSYVAAIEASAPYIDHVESVRGYRPYQYAERLARRLPSELL